jgi:Spy/CpxP family protein refolding chaperone
MRSDLVCSARYAAEKFRDALANTPNSSDSPARSDGLTQAQRLELRRKMLDVLTPKQRTKAVAFQQGR